MTEAQAEGTLSYFWLPVADADRARSFYSGLFGWQFEPGGSPGSYQITGVSPLGGVAGGMPDSGAIRVVFSVKDINAATQRVRELGGEAGEPMSSDSGWHVDCHDNQGVLFSLSQSP